MRKTYVKILVKYLENTCKGVYFSKVVDPQHAAMSIKWTILQVYFNWFVYNLGAPPSK